jgi:hypothetical protein
LRSKLNNDLAPEASFEEMTKYMAVWKRVYSEMVGAFKPRDGKVFLDFDRFAEAPEANFRSLTAALDLEYDPTALVRPSPGHSLGGNGAAFRRVRDADYRVDVRPLGEPAIPDDHAAWIDSQVDITELHATMRRLSEEREALLI